MKWIRVNQKEPNVGDEVLVYCKRVESEIGYHVDTPSIVKVEWSNRKSCNAVDCDYYEVIAINITHWMPLPEIPKD